MALTVVSTGHRARKGFSKKSGPIQEWSLEKAPDWGKSLTLCEMQKTECIYGL